MNSDDEFEKRLDEDKNKKKEKGTFVVVVIVDKSSIPLKKNYYWEKYYLLHRLHCFVHQQHEQQRHINQSQPHIMHSIDKPHLTYYLCHKKINFDECAIHPKS